MEATHFGVDLTLVNGSHTLEVTAAEKAVLQDLLEQVRINPYTDLEEFILNANLIFHELPRRLRYRLVEFQRTGNQEGVLLIRNLPTDPELGDTPVESHVRPAKMTWASEFWSVVFSTPLGEPVGYLQEKQGQIFQNIYPTRKNEAMLSSESSKILLDFHTEIAFHPHMMDYLLLYCLRQDHDKKARTVTASIRKIYELLTKEQRDLLKQTVFETGVDFSFGSQNATRGGGMLTSILYGNEDDPYFRFDPDLMLGKTEEAHNLLMIVKELANQVAGYICLQPGDLLVINNRQAIHARTEFSPRYDGKDRWLQRLCIIRDLHESASHRKRGGRVIQTSFAT